MGIFDSIIKPKHKVSTPTSVSKEPKYIEVDWKGGKSDTRDYVRVLSLNEFSDVEGILDRLRDRNSIVILKIKPKLVQEKIELKRALKRIQRTCQAIGGDIAGIKEDVIVITPPEMEIARPSEGAASAEVAEPESVIEREETASTA